MNLMSWFRIFLVTLISSLFLPLLPEILVLAISKAREANLVCLCFGDKACCTSARNPVTMASLWRLMECLSVIVWPSAFSLNHSPLFILSARFIPKGKPWHTHTHTIWSKKKGKNGDRAVASESCPITWLCDYARRKKKPIKFDSVAKTILLLLHTICIIWEPGCFELQKFELTISDSTCFEPSKLWQNFSL